MRRRIWLTIAVVVALLLIFGRTLIQFYTDWLWFGEVGYRQVFWTQLWSRLELGLIAGLVFFAITYLNLWLARRFAPAPVSDRYRENELRQRIGRYARTGLTFLIFAATVVVSFLVALEASGHWMGFLMFLKSVPFGEVDPIFKRDIGFYVFKLGFLNYINGWLFFTLVVALIATAAVHYTDRAIEFLAGRPTFAPHVRAHLSLLLAGLFFIKAWSYRLDAYNLLYSEHGFVYGAGYTDVHAKLLALNVLMVVAILAGLLTLINLIRREIVLPLVALGTLVVVSILFGGVYPMLMQAWYVKPNEINKESPYIANNISYTRKAFNLDGINQQAFPAIANLSATDVSANRATINSIRLWDYRPLQDTYNQLQALWQYYEFLPVDVDRYTINGELRQVMLGARELSFETSQQQTGASTWLNRHFQYTHGFGAVMSPVNRATNEGLPDFFVKDIPPVSTLGIDITRPEIYYGEATSSYAVVNSNQKEFDYPLSAGEAQYTSYAGKGGIPIGNYMTRLLFAWRFADTNLALSNPTNANSRLMFRRQIGPRMQTIAPFLLYDPDPYLVIADGKLYWMQDAYTVSENYPYSTPQQLSDFDYINYMRNSVKAVVDAYDGTVNYYIADEADPVVQTYARIFPGLFKPMSEMPGSLKPHIRYPELLFRVQSEVLLRYHMTSPQVFFNRADLWSIPNEITGTSGEPTPIEPYYVVMKLPGDTAEHFLLMRPFTPANRDNMVAWMGAMCDPDDYGKVILYEFPKKDLVYGPAQIESRINQDPSISSQLTLWNQQGSRVNRGNLLVIPIEKSIVYVKPIYLQSESSKIPELKRVVVAYGDQVAMEPTLEAAIADIFGGAAGAQPTPSAPAQPSAGAKPSAGARPPAAGPPVALTPQTRQLIGQAWNQYRSAGDAQRRGDWATYGQQQKALEQTLRQLQQSAGGR